MEGIDQRPSGKWRAQVRRTGFRSRSKSFSTKAEAVRWKRKVDGEMDRGLDQDLGKMRKDTIEDLLDRFLLEEVHLRKGERWDRTRIAYWKANADFVKRRLDQHLVEALRKYFTERQAEVSSATVCRDMNLLSGIFKLAMKKWGLPLASNPVRALQRPAVKSKGPGRLWTSGELEQLKAKALELGYGEGGRLKTTHDYIVPAVELSLESAMRIGEVCSIEAKDIDFERQVLMLDETKNGDWRKVPLSTRAVEILRPLVAAAQERLKQFPERELALGSKARLASLVVPMSSDTLGLRYRQLRAAAGIKGLRFHDTRHTAATHASKKLSNILELSSFTGHRSLQSLKRYYHADATDIAKKLG